MPANSASAIAALEVRTDDNDKNRNEILKPVPHPYVIEDFMRCLIETKKNSQRNMKLGSGFLWARNNRLGLLYHLHPLTILKLMYSDFRRPSDEKMEKIHANIKLAGDE